MRTIKKKLTYRIFIAIPGILLGVLAFFEAASPITESKFDERLFARMPSFSIAHSNSLLAPKDSFVGEPRGERYIRTITAYHPVPWETDETPCISASGMDICQTSKKICASNEFPFGTRLLIGEEICEVQDRLNSKYKKLIDLFFKTKEGVDSWGKRRMEVIKLD